MGEFSLQVAHVARLVARKIAQQSVISGLNPSSYNASNPFPLFVIQTVIIIAVTQLLASLFRHIRQPRVIAEIIGGIILGPTVCGRIPGFQSHIFPTTSLPILNLVSTIGLVFYLFLVGLEVDIKIIKRNAKVATTVSAAGLIVPAGVGAAFGIVIYNEFANKSLNIGYFVLFTSVAVGITAFPVMCRILSELKILNTTVGLVSLSAGVGNDVVGWILLALTVALVSVSSGLAALYILLISAAFVVILLYPGRWAYYWLAKHSGSLEQGSPTTGMMTITLLFIFAASFFTDIIGIHAVFGGFLAGLIVPHENGFAISMVEKLEDLVSLVFLPIYFALSGLKTDFSSMNTGKAWGYTIALCLVSFFSKFISCFIAATGFGFNWRESGAVGTLMASKGLIELIVLNIGLQSGILDTRTFTMFVVHGMALTFVTTPVTYLFYPPRYQTRHGSGHRAESGNGTLAVPSYDDDLKTNFSLILDRIEQISAAMKISYLLQLGKKNCDSSFSGSVDEKAENQFSSLSSVSPVSIHALRLIELTNRTSAVLKSQLSEAVAITDPVVSAIKTFGCLHNLEVSATLTVVGHDEFASAIVRHVEETKSQMVMLPWSRSAPSDNEGTMQSGNPFDGIPLKSQADAVVHSEFIRRVFATAPTSVAVFVDNEPNTSYSRNRSSGPHLFLPFFGGPDDRLALSFLVQLCHNASVRATVVRIQQEGPLSPSSTTKMEMDISFPTQTSTATDTVYGQQTTQTRLASETADLVLWNRYTTERASVDANTTSALSRITFSMEESQTPLQRVVELVQKESHQNMTVIVMAGRSRTMNMESRFPELREIASGSSIGSSAAKTLGGVGAALAAKGTPASLLIMQAYAGSA